MEKLFTQKEITLVESKIRSFEEKTRADLLVVITDSSDPYPASCWRFGFVTSIIFSFIFAYYIEFNHPLLWPLFFMILTLICVWIGHFPWAKRLTLAFWEVERECKEKAIELFHSLGTSQVSHQVTAMIMISLFEREIEVLVDKKLAEKLDQKDLENLIELMKSKFKKNQFAEGLIDSISALEVKILKNFGGPVCNTATSELHDSIIFVRD